MFPVKHTVIYTFFAITSVQNTCFCSVFNALASKNPAKSCYVQCFFHFWPFFHCRKATKMTQNSISIPSCAQTPKNPRKMSKTPPYSGLGAKPFLAPPAKADIATAILTNVIEHLVLLLPPNKHAFTAKAVWADFKGPQALPQIRSLNVRSVSTACSFPLCVSWHQRSCALCGVLPSPPCCACGSGACRLHAESVLPLVLGPTSRPQFNAACDRPPCLMLLFFPRPPCPALLLLPLLPLFCSSFLSLLLFVLLLTKLGSLLRSSGVH